MRALLLVALFCGLAMPGRCGTGDVDGDGRIRLDDAVLAARMMSSTSYGTAQERDRADVIPLTSEAGDGRVTIGDVAFILRVVAGLEADPSWLTLRIFVYHVSDDDGSRPAEITPLLVEQWLAYANTVVYGPARVRLTFSRADFAALRSTLLNNMTGNGDALWEAENAAAQQAAALHPGYVTLIFRHGPGAGATGGGFSWWDSRYVAMPGFYNTWVCGHQNLGLLAHELGHYLGLPHTFAATFSTIDQAAAYFDEHGRNPAVFDGDGIADTAPDPYIDEIQCTDAENVVLSGVTLPILRHNVMSYWEAPQRTLTPQQIQRVRWTIRTKARNGMSWPTNAGVPSPIEAESLPVAATYHSGTGVQAMDPWNASRWSGGKQVFIGAQADGSVTFSLVRDAAERVFLSAWFTQAPDFGIVQVLVNGKALGDPFDAWSFEVIPSGRIPLGNVDLSAGSNSVKLQCVGRNPLSTNTYMGLDCLTLEAPQ